ncbi:MAG: hypothetical protein IT546_00130 [Caulobacteraceae bacterium]|nr:hypothetical protein [Caulobacteraceae bacterium]
MTGDVEPMIRVDAGRAAMFVRGLVLRAAFEGACILAGLGAWFMTGQILWLAVAVAIGSAPVALHVLRHARRNRELQALAHATQANRSIVE